MKKFVVTSGVLLSLVIGLGAFLYATCVIEESDPQFAPVAYEFHYKGKPYSGAVYSLHTNGKLRHLIFMWRGKKVGTESIWYDTGAIMAERPHVNGEPHGLWKQWYEDGSAKSLKTYHQGQINGEVWGWHANGQISDFNFYEDGKELTHKSWISDGTPYYNYVYQDGKKIGIRGGDFCKRLEKIR